jgi:methanogenic corrinoid protein MtbC1
MPDEILKRSGNAKYAQQQGNGTDVDWMDAMNAFNDSASPLNEKQIMELLSNVVEGEIIPRLMLAHQTFASQNAIDIADAVLTDDEITNFARLAIDGEVDDLEDYVVDMTRRGIAIEAVYLDLLAPAARKLGQYWEQDQLSFTDVTIGLGRLQTLLYRVSARQKGINDNTALMPHGLFVTTVGGQHSFGIRMVEDLFRRAGWKTLCEPNLPIGEATSLVKMEYFDLLGIGISIEDQIEPAREMVIAARAASQNSGIQIMIGGSLMVEHPEIAGYIGADLSAIDAREAVTIAQNIIYDQKLRH